MFEFFSFLWAVASLLFCSLQSFWANDKFAIPLTVLALGCLFQPSSLKWFLGLIALRCFAILGRFPIVPEGYVLVLIVDLSILAVFLRLCFRTKNFIIDREIFFEEFASIGRLVFLIFYFFAAFSKYNTDFLSYEVSCGAKHYLLLAKKFALLPTAPWAQTIAIVGVLMTESLVPPLLIFPISRYAGILLGILFHFVIGINYFPGYSFYGISALLFALFSLFLPRNFSSLLIKFRESSPALKKFSSNRKLSYAFLLFLFLLTLANPNNSSLHLFLWSCYGLAVIALFTLPFRYGKADWHSIKSLCWISHPPLALFPVLILFDVLCPFLGFKTVGSFHSNLRTEGGKSNHLFIPSSFQIVDFQKDLVQIESSSEPFLQLHASRKNLLPYFAIRSYISRVAREGKKNIELTFVRGGKIRSLRNAETDPELSKPYPWILQKIMFLRAIRPEQRTPEECRENPDWSQFF